MEASKADLIIQLIHEPIDDRRLMAPLAIGLDLTVWASFNPALPTSVVGSRCLRRILDRSGEVISELPSGGYLVRSLSIRGQPVPDMAVRLSRIAEILGYDCVIGYDWLEQFVELRLDTRAEVLTLVYP